MRPRPWFLALAAGLVLHGAAHATDAASVAAALEGEEAECRFLLGLCRAANRARDRASETPLHLEGLAVKEQREAELWSAEAAEAGRVIAGKHGTKRPQCLDHPECAFLRGARTR